MQLQKQKLQGVYQKMNKKLKKFLYPKINSKHRNYFRWSAYFELIGFLFIFLDFLFCFIFLACFFIFGKIFLGISSTSILIKTIFLFSILFYLIGSLIASFVAVSKKEALTNFGLPLSLNLYFGIFREARVFWRGRKAFFCGILNILIWILLVTVLLPKFF